MKYQTILSLPSLPTIRTLAVALLLTSAGAPLFAAEIEVEKVPHSFSAIEENDYLYDPNQGHHQDRHYTQGMKFFYLQGGEPWWAKGLGLPALSKQLPDLWLNPTSTTFGLNVGQNIYTPQNNGATNLLRTDRPYAGWLYIGAMIQRRGEVMDRIPVLETFGFDIGIIGPEAQAGRSQNEFHKFREIDGFDGWGNQLKTEPAFVFKYGRAWKLSINEASSHYFDVIPNVGANLGALLVSANAGATARLGFNLPDDFGIQTIDSPIVLAPGGSRGPVGFYAFGQLEGRAVARNVFLDGNLYRRSFHIDKEPFVGDLIYGVALTLGKHFDLSYARVVRTKEFEGQRGYDRFGSLNLNLKWGF
ncbi:MAG: lipid A deacylase LpxR family protein [Verrucomicrobiota bacterium]